MEYDITHLIAKIVRDQPDFDRRMNERADSLGGIACIKPSIGQWTDAGIEFLFAALELDDADFARQLPALADLTKPARAQLLRTFSDHVSVCPHCAAKYDRELDLNARVEKALRENSDLLLRQLLAETSA